MARSGCAQRFQSLRVGAAVIDDDPLKIWKCLIHHTAECLFPVGGTVVKGGDDADERMYMISSKTVR